MTGVLQDWVVRLPLAMQGTLLTAVRGPDGVRKEHPVKQILRAYRRAVLNGAKPVPNNFMHEEPYLTNAELAPLAGGVAGEGRLALLERFFATQVDDLPHHFLMHLIHSAQVVGTHYPADVLRGWGSQTVRPRMFWVDVYCTAVGSFHMRVEEAGDFAGRLRDRGAF